MLSSWLAAPCKQLLCLLVIAETWALAAGSNSVVKLLGGRVSIWMVSSSWLAALCKQLLCLIGEQLPILGFIGRCSCLLGIDDTKACTVLMASSLSWMLPVFNAFYEGVEGALNS